MKKIICKGCSFLSGIVLAVVIAIVIVLLAPRVFGYDILVVLSGSMEPTYHVGSVVYVDKNVKADEIEVGDPITFYKEENVVATHRAIQIDKENQQFITKGDANNTQDINPIPFSSLIGKAVFTIPMIGFVSVYIKTAKGIIAACFVLALVVLLYAIPEILKVEVDEPGRKKVQKNVQKE